MLQLLFLIVKVVNEVIFNVNIYKTNKRTNEQKSKVHNIENCVKRFALIYKTKSISLVWFHFVSVSVVRWFGKIVFFAIVALFCRLSFWNWFVCEPLTQIRYIHSKMKCAWYWKKNWQVTTKNAIHNTDTAIHTPLRPWCKVYLL